MLLLVRQLIKVEDHLAVVVVSKSEEEILRLVVCLFA